jgi:serine/threonine-protein kinase
VHDTGEHAGAPFIVMERLSGRTLADEVMRGPLVDAHVRKILDDVLSALAAAHAAGILHRDIKPANILFTASGDVKVADFGIAKSAETPATLAGQIVGTMAYLSADRLMGRPSTVSDDLYSVGVVGYEALTGLKPFPQENLAALARAISEDVPAPIQAHRPDAEPGLAATIERAMARDPHWRFASAESMRAALQGVPQPISHRPPTRVLAEPLPPPATMALAPIPAPSQTRRLLVLAAVLFAIALAAVLVLFESASRPSAPEPATSSTSLPPPSPPPTSSLAPAPPPPPAQIDEGPPGKKKGNGNGNGRKKGG